MEIYDHDSPEYISFKNNNLELEDWLDHLTYIQKEIKSLILLGQRSKNTSEIESFLKTLQNKTTENSMVAEELQKYKNTLPKALECDDVSCDMFYVNEHEKFRKTFRSHLETYRDMKQKFFGLLINI